MSITYTNAQIGVVDNEGNVNVIYPVTSGNNVAIEPSQHLSSATTLQQLVNNLGLSAFKSVEDDYTVNNINAVASSSALYQAIQALQSQTNESGLIPVNPTDTSNKNIWIEIND